MANLFTATQQMTAPGGYLTNKFSSTPGMTAPVVPTSELYNTPAAASMGPANQDGAWWGQELLAHAAAAPVDVVDTLATLFPGVERGSVNDAVYETIGLPGVARWVREHQGGVEIGSGILGSIIVGGAAAKVAKGIAGAAWFQSTGIGGWTTAQIAKVAASQQAAQMAVLDAARLGQTIGTFSGANRTYMLSRIGMGALKASASEVAVVAALHNNTAIWSDDMTTNALFFGLSGAIGATAGLIGGRGVVQRWANSQVVRDTFAEAADPGKYDQVLSQTPFTGVDTTHLSELRGPVKSSEFTALMLNARRDDSSVGFPAAGESRNAIRTGEERAALQALQTMTRKGLYGVPETKFNTAGTPHGRQIIEAAREDPSVLLGSTELAQIPANTTLKKLLADRDEVIQLMYKDPLATNDQLTLAKQMQSESPLVLMGKRWMSVADAEELIDYTPLHPKQIQSTSAGRLETSWSAPLSGKKITLRQDGRFTGNWEGYTFKDKLSIIDGMRDMSKRLLSDSSQPILTIPKDALFLELDFAVYHAGKGGAVDFSSAAHFTSIEDVQLGSLRLKAKKAQEILKRGGRLDFKTRLSLNLPQASTLESAADPQGAGLTSLLSQTLTSKVSLGDLKNLREQAFRTLDIGTDAAIDSRLDGDIFNWNRSQYADVGKTGDWMAPVVGMFDDPSKIKWSRWNLGDIVAEQKALSIRSLSSRRAPFAKSLTESIINSPGVQKVMDMLGLNDAQIGGTRGVVSSIGSQAVTQAHRFRNNETLLAAQQIRRAVNRQVEVHLDSVLQNVKQFTDQLVSVAGGRSRVLYNQYATYSPGWDLDKVIPVSTKSGQGWAFTLRGSARNIDRLNKLGQQWTEGMTLRTPDGVEVVLDDLANDTREALEAQYKDLLKNRNQIRLARGLDPIEEKQFYVPPPSTKDKLIGFVLDADNRVVPGMTVMAKTRDQFNELSKIVKGKLNSAQGQRFVTQGEIEDFADLWEQAQMGFTDPLDFIDPQALSGAKGQQAGKLAGAYVNPRAFEDGLEYLKHGYEQVGSGVIRTIFDSQLKISAIRHQASKLTHGQANLTKDIWQTFDETLLGISATSNPRGINVLTGQVDKAMDSILETAWKPLHTSSNWVKDLVSRIGYQGGRKVKTFTELADELGKHMPFATVNDYAQYQYGLTPPWKAAGLSRASNRFASGIVLRWLELPHAVMNMTGLITAMPLLLTAKNVPTLGKINNVGIVDSTKIIARGMKRQFKQTGADWDFMVRNGDTTQDVAELHKQLALLDGKGKFASIMLGDEKYSDWAKHPKGSLERSKAFLRYKGVEGMASIVTDSSENWSRRTAHFVGLELADYHGITGMEARHNFARQFANDAIANYDPLNRPEMFQSAFGSMYGLFLSYAQNYYQRLYRWVEDGDFKSVGKSLAMQSAIFGIGGTPGFRELSALVGGEQDGDGLMDGIYERFGPTVGSVLAQGGMNQITTLLGLPAVSLHTRGDVSVRHPAIDFARGAPVLPVGLEVLKDLGTGILGVLGTMTDPSAPETSRHAAEIMARNMPSRMIRGAISVLALGGQEADVFGNLMSETKTDAEAMFRMLGLRSARQQAEIEAYFLNQKSLAIDADRMEKVRSASRALIRDGAYDRLPEVFEDYVNAGGKPWNYSNWVKDLIIDSQNTRGENQLFRMMKGAGNEVLVNRLRVMGLMQE